MDATGSTTSSHSSDSELLEDCPIYHPSKQSAKAIRPIDELLEQKAEDTALMAKFSLLQTSKELSALKMVDSSLSLSHMNMNASLNNRSFFLCDLDVAFQRQFQRDLDIFSTLIMTPFSGITCEDTAQYIIGNLDNLNFLPAQTLSSAFLAQKWEISKLLDYDQSQTILKILLHLSLDERVFFTYFDELKCAVCFFTALLSKREYLFAEHLLNPLPISIQVKLLDRLVSFGVSSIVVRAFVKFTMKELAKFMELNLNPVDSLDFGSIELKSYVSLIAAHIQELEVDQAVKKLYYFEAFVCLSFHLITFSKNSDNCPKIFDFLSNFKGSFATFSIAGVKNIRQVLLLLACLDSKLNTSLLP